jgi:hypothetical protein
LQSRAEPGIQRVALNLPLPAGLPEKYIAGNFRELVAQASGQRVVVLVVKYDADISRGQQHPHR